MPLPRRDNWASSRCRNGRRVAYRHAPKKPEETARQCRRPDRPDRRPNYDGCLSSGSSVMASFTPFATSTEVAPITCMHCGQNALYVRATPDSKGRPYTYQLFECTGMSPPGDADGCEAEQASDAEIQALAERIAGVPPRPRRKLTRYFAPQATSHHLWSRRTPDRRPHPAPARSSSSGGSGCAGAAS